MARPAARKQAVSRRRSAGPQKPARPGGSAQLGDFAIRAKVMGGAAQVFVARGVRAASVEDILLAAGISRRTFYKAYQSKEDVALELYRFGTQRLVEMCRLAIAEETDPRRQLERCIEAHLRNARELGRLVFVLGGEAQRAESALHARRMEVQESLVSFLVTAAATPSGAAYRADPLLYRALILALEGTTRYVLEEADEGRAITDASIDRIRQVMLRLVHSLLDA